MKKVTRFYSTFPRSAAVQAFNVRSSLGHSSLYQLRLVGIINVLVFERLQIEPYFAAAMEIKTRIKALGVFGNFANDGS